MSEGLPVIGGIIAIHAITSSLTSKCNCIYINAIAFITRSSASEARTDQAERYPAFGFKKVPFFGRELHVYLNNGKPKAVANVCLHFGGPLECKEGKLVCAWHNASFDMSTCERLEGPTPKGSKLMALSTRVDDGALYYVWGE